MKQDVHTAQRSHDRLAPTIYHEPWWLDIATGGTYGVVEVAENGETIGRLPYFLQRKFGLTYSVPPRMVHALGPAIDLIGGGETQLQKSAKVTRELIAGLPPAAVYKYKCQGGVDDVIAFQQENFMTGVQFTYEVAPRPPEILWSNLRKSKRSEIRRAQKLLHSTTIDEPEEFWRFYTDNIRRRGQENAYESISARRIIAESLVRGRGRIYAAREAGGSLAAAIFCVWDRASTYYFMTTRAAKAHDGAVSLLVWTAIEEAAQRGLIFDFDGLGNTESVAFYAGFGGVPRPRYIVTRATTLGRIAWELKEALRENRYFC